MSRLINLTLRVWRQKSPEQRGRLETYPARDISVDCSFMEMLDLVNEQLITDGKEPVAFESDCREGACGVCGAVVNGRAHGPVSGTTLCQLYMRHFSDGDVLVIEPWRARAFPILKDLVVDRSAFDKIMQAGGYISVNTGAAPEANSILVPPQAAEQALDAGQCIGCGACVSACPNSSAMLFLAAKISHLALLPQGLPEAARRAVCMVTRMDQLGFGNCSNHRECEAVCPKKISIVNIARLNREYFKARFFSGQK